MKFKSLSLIGLALLAISITKSDLAMINPTNDQKNFFNAISWLNVEAVKGFLKPGFNINCVDEEGQTALHVISRSNYRKENQLLIMQLLLSNGAKINYADKYGITPLHVACGKRGRKKIAKLLLDKGADINSTDQWEWTPLHCASLWINFKIVKLLLDNGAEINRANKDGDTSLHLSSRCSNHLEIAKILLKSDADINHKNKNGLNALDLAKSYNNKGNNSEIVQLISDAIKKQEEFKEKKLQHFSSKLLDSLDKYPLQIIEADAKLPKAHALIECKNKSTGNNNMGLLTNSFVLKRGKPETMMEKIFYWWNVLSA